MKNQNLKIVLIMGSILGAILAFGQKLFSSPASSGMGLANTILKKAGDYIARWEGFIPKAFWDYKQYTNGYGTKALSQNEVINKEVALVRLMTEANRLLSTVNGYNLALTESQKIALIDFGYNLGPAPMQLMCKRLKDGNSMAFVAGKIQEYNKAGNPLKVLAQLDQRRKSEAKLLLKQSIL